MISDRLATIAYMIDSNKVVFDVGSDHGQLPCFLVESQISPKAYAGDIAIGPLKHAKETIKKAGLEEKVIPVLSDGLAKANSDVDVVVISGMGYHTIIHILDSCDVSAYQYFIIQSNTDVELLRKYISDHNYTIEDERIIFDGFYYQIIKFSADLHDTYSDDEIKFGPILLKKRDHIFIEYLKQRRDKLIEINKEANKKEIREEIENIDRILNK